jgi:WD40 repeat protein
MAAPYHVRLAVSQYGEQFRAELFTEDLGDTEGDLLTELPPSIAEWIPYLAQGADLPPDAARQLGKDLFAALLGQPENAKKWAEVLTQAARRNQPIRLLIDAVTEAVRDLPYGLLCEPHDDWFLFRGGKSRSVGFVRILRRCSPRPLKLRERPLVLVAVAEPTSADVAPFDAPRRLQKLTAEVRKAVDIVVCGPAGPKPLAEIAPDLEASDPAAFAPYTRTTRDALRTALAGEYDVFHLLAHGHGAGVLLCNPDGSPAETTASELGDWCGAGRTALAFLQVCKAGQTAGRGGFGGVAQQLLNPRGGNLAAVVASTFPLDAEHSTDAAGGFYRRLAAGSPPEEALTAERPETDWSWAFLELWARPGALGGTEQRAAFQFVSPYRGLSSFGEQDADLFFGRKVEVAELLQVLRAEPAVAVVGDSGSGKTSLLQAGLVHAIRHEGLAGCDRWRILSLRPGYRPAQALLAALTGAHAEPTPDALIAAVLADAQPLVIVFDQFEEAFTLARDKADLQMLTAALEEAVERRRDRFRLVIGMRSEFLGQAASVPGLSRLVRRPWVLRPPGADDLRDIVAGPAEHCGYTFQGPLADGNPAHAVSLLDRILADPLLARDAGGANAAPLPLLQFALERLWLKAVEQGVTDFTHAGLDDIGGMGKAIAQHAEAVFQASATAAGVGAQGRAFAEQIITALVSTQGTRQPRVREALQAETSNPEAARAVVDYLVGERLLTVRSDPEDITKSLVDLSHEALIQNWDRLRGWLAEDPQGRAMREEFRKATEQWDAGVAGGQPRSRSGLPGADVATNYLAWIGTARPRLSPTQQEFAAALRAMLVRRRRVRRVVMGTLTGLTLAASLLAVLAFYLAGRANDSAEKAKEQTAALTLDLGVRLCEQGRPRTGLLTIAESLTLCPPEATDLRRVIRTNLAAWAPAVMCLDEARRLGDAALGASRDGEVALIAVGDDSMQLVEMDTSNPVGPPFGSRRKAGTWARIVRHEDGWRVLTFGPTGAQLWNGKTGQPVGPTVAAKEIGRITGKYESITSATLGPDRRKFAIGLDHRGGVWIWDGQTGQQVGDPLPHEGRVNDVAFMPDGKMLLTGCGVSVADPAGVAPVGPEKKAESAKSGGIARLWNLDTGQFEWQEWYPDPVMVVAVSPDPAGRFIMAGGVECRIWERNPDRKPPLVAFRAPIRLAEPARWGGAAFSPDPDNPGALLLARPSGHIDIYHLDINHLLPGREPERLSPQGWVAAVGFRPKDHTMFTLNADGTARIWRFPVPPEAQKVYGRPDAVLSVAFGPASETFAAACQDGHVYLWATDDPAQPVRRFDAPPPPDGRPPHPIVQVLVSADGARIIAQDLYCRILVWETATGQPVEPPDGEILVGAADDGVTVLTELPDRMYRVRNLRTGKAGTPFAIPGRLGPDPEEADEDAYLLRVKRAAFSPDRTLVVVINGTGRAEIHRADTGALVEAPMTHTIYKREEEGIRAVEFSPDGSRILTRSNHGMVVCVLATPDVGDSYPNRVGVQAARFSPDGRLILMATNFNMARLWDVREKQIRPVALLHSAQVWGMAANPGCDRIATASYDHTARVWDAVTGKPISPPLFHDEGVSDVSFSHDGTRVLTSSWDHNVRLWPVIEPVPDEPERVKAWIETMTGLKTGVPGSSELLTSDEWSARKKQLDELGGPP